MRSILTLISILTITASYGQDYGYFGQKNTITLSGTFSPRLISNLLYKGRDFNTASYPLTFGGTIRYDRQLKSRRKQIGFELVYTQTANRLNHIGAMYINYDNYGISTNNLFTLLEGSPIKTTVIAPMITFSKAVYSDQMPIGLVNTMGAGLLIAKHKEMKNAVYGTRETSSIDPTIYNSLIDFVAKNAVDPELYSKPVFGLRFFWQTAYNLPITKNIIWSFAVRGNISAYFPLLTSRGKSQNEMYIIDSQQFNKSFATQEILNILEINTGLKIAF